MKYIIALVLTVMAVNIELENKDHYECPVCKSNDEALDLILDSDVEVEIVD